MIEAQIPANEERRLAALRALHILDTPREERFDSVTRLARHIFGVTCASISFIDSDRQWFKSNQGLEFLQTERRSSFCAHAILGDEVMVVPDAAVDIRFHDNPLVASAPNIRFYAGYPLKAGTGDRLGTLCIVDREPRNLSAHEVETLAALGAIVERELGSEISNDAETGLLTRAGFDLVGRYCVDWCRDAGIPSMVRLFWVRRERDPRSASALSSADAQHFADQLRGFHRSNDVLARLSANLFGLVEVGVSEGRMAYESRFGGRAEGDQGAPLIVDESCVRLDSSSPTAFRDHVLDAWADLQLEVRRRNVEQRTIHSEQEILQLVAFTAIYQALPMVAPWLQRRGSLFESGYGTICCVNKANRLSQVRLHPDVLAMFLNGGGSGRGVVLAKLVEHIRVVLDTASERIDLGVAELT